MQKGGRDGCEHKRRFRACRFQRIAFFCNNDS
jgi:hypothetical protein